MGGTHRTSVLMLLAWPSLVAALFAAIVNQAQAQSSDAPLVQGPLQPGMMLDLDGHLATRIAGDLAQPGKGGRTDATRHDVPAEETRGQDRFWANAEAIWWRISKAPQPTPLVTTGTTAGTFPAQIPGALGQPGTSVVLGGTSVSLPVEMGGRFALGGWIDRTARVGLEVGGLFLAVRLEGANHQWRKNPPGELLIDPVADERLVRVTVRVGAS